TRGQDPSENPKIEKPQSLVLKNLRPIGVTGLEAATSWSWSNRCNPRAFGPKTPYFPAFYAHAGLFASCYIELRRDVKKTAEIQQLGDDCAEDSEKRTRGRPVQRVAMTFYSRAIVPLLCDFGPNRPFVAKYRRELLAQASGNILEIGFGTGLNL